MSDDQLDLFTVPMSTNERSSASDLSVADHEVFTEIGENPTIQPMTSSVVVRFPLARRRRKIVTVSATLAERKTEQGRSTYWVKIINDLAAELRRHGADQSEIDRQLSGFHQAVSLELARRQARPNPGAA